LVLRKQGPPPRGKMRAERFCIPKNARSPERAWAAVFCQASMPSFRGVVISACALCDRFFREMAFLLNINIRTHAFVAERTDYESVAIRGFAGLFGQW